MRPASQNLLHPRCQPGPALHFQLPAFSACRVDRQKYQIQIPLPAKIDPSVTMMTVEEKPDVTYSDLGGCKEQIEKMREVGGPHAPGRGASKGCLEGVPARTWKPWAQAAAAPPTHECPGTWRPMAAPTLMQLDSLCRHCFNSVPSVGHCLHRLLRRRRCCGELPAWYWKEDGVCWKEPRDR